MTTTNYKELIQVRGRDIATDNGFVAEVTQAKNAALVNKIVFIDDVLPGETAEAQIINENKKFINENLSK